MKRIVLFLLTNLAVLVLLSIVVSVLGLDRVLAQQGIQLLPLLIFAGVFGMGGAFISLLLSKWMAKWTTGAVVIDQPRSEIEHWLLTTVRRQAERAGIGMPEVAIYDSPDVNAFATGASRDKALVAVSTGLLQRMDRDEIEAVLGHEVSHIANGDMVTLTLIQGVLNTFVIFLSRIIGYVVDRMILKNERGYGLGYYATVILAEIVLGILASLVVFWFSRQREFRADAGGARLAGQHKMIAALEALRRVHEPEPLPDQLAAFGINGGRPAGWRRLFMTHPPIEERIEALKMLRF
ncbi:MAG TPA: protease HtpX [Gammaproteobacteria bacterium]|nr:protease HtpX [Gammaproteobacteria bacterium]